MNTKACLGLLLCLLAISIVCTTALVALRALAPDGKVGNNKSGSVSFLTLGDNLIHPDWEDKGGGGWP